MKYAYAGVVWPPTTTAINFILRRGQIPMRPPKKKQPQEVIGRDEDFIASFGFDLAGGGCS